METVLYALAAPYLFVWGRLVRPLCATLAHFPALLVVMAAVTLLAPLAGLLLFGRGKDAPPGPRF